MSAESTDGSEQLIVISEVHHGDEIRFAYVAPERDTRRRVYSPRIPKRTFEQGLDEIQSARDLYARSLAIKLAVSPERDDSGVQTWPAEQAGRDHTPPLLRLRAAVSSLVAWVRPQDGLLALVGRSEREIPQLLLDLVGPLASRVPWEAMSDECYHCRQCRAYFGLTRTGVCRCGGLLEKVVEPLAICARVSVVPELGLLPRTRGEKFAMIVAPTPDLFEGNHAKRIAYAHMRGLKDLVQRAGYTPSPVWGKAATCENLKVLLRDDKLLGLYYFGHAERGHGANKARLKLYDGDLTADEIKKLSRIPFVFLNGCDAASGDAGSLALAFGGQGKVVIAPPFEACLAESVRLAQDFFTQSMQHQLPIDRAWVRVCEAQKEHADAAALWPYRLLGDPKRFLPKVVTDAETQPIFVDGHVNARAFGFDVQRVLASGAHGCKIDAREQVQIADLFAGLLHAGEITPSVFRDLVVDPDVLLATLFDAPDGRPSQLQPSAADSVHDVPLDASVIKLLESVPRHRQHGARVVVSELSLLGHIVETADLGFLNVMDAQRGELRATIDASMHAVSAIDHNGHVDVSDLTVRAQGILERAAELARLDSTNPRGVVRGKHLFLAFLDDEQGCLAHCQRRHRRPDLALGERRPLQADVSHFQLSVRLASPRITALLGDARGRAPRRITPARLLRAFCRTADMETQWFVKDGWLAPDESWSMVFGDCECVCLGPRKLLTALPAHLSKVLQTRCNAGAREVLLRFAQLAEESGSCSNRLLFAAFLDQSRANTATVLEDVETHAARKAMSELLIDRSCTLEPSRDLAMLHQRIVALVGAKDGDKNKDKLLDVNALLSSFMRNAPREFKLGLRALLRDAWYTTGDKWFEQLER